MNIRIIISFLFLIIYQSELFWQKGFTKTIVDANTKLPLDYVYVNSDNKKLNLLSNKEGKLILVNDATIKSYSFYKIGYTKQIILTADLFKTDTVFLVEKFIGLDEIIITSKLIDTLVKDKRFYVNDYLILPNNDFLLLTSKINIKGFEIAYYKKYKGITCRKKIKDETSEHFFTDCFKIQHLVTNVYSRQLFFDSDSSFDFLPKYSRAKFDSTLAVCALKVDSEVILKYSLPPKRVKGGFLQNSYFLSYLKVNKDKKQLFHTIFYSKELMQMAEYEIGDYEMIVANTKLLGAQALSDAAIANLHQLFYSKITAPIYAPIFLKNDTVVIFNFQENLIITLDKSGKIFNQTPIDVSKFSSYRDFEIICDQPKQKFYIKTKKTDRACLQLINIYTGDISSEIKLEKTFAKNIQVQNGRIYYLVKEKQWDDTSYLYQQN